MTFVLIHGAHHGSWCWERLVPLLDRESVAVDLPGPQRGTGETDVTLKSWAEAVLHQVHGDELVLVGHSFAGMTIPYVAQALGSAVRHAVFVSAAVARPNDDLYASLPPLLGRLGRLSSGRSNGKAAMEPNAYWCRKRLCNDMDEEQTAWTLERLTPEPVGPTLERASVTMADVPHLPVTYVRLMRDKGFSMRRQTQLAARLGDRVRLETLDAGHDVMISRPAELAAVLNRI